MLSVQSKVKKKKIMNSACQIESPKMRPESLVYDACVDSAITFIYLCRKTNISVCCFCVSRSFSGYMTGFMLFTHADVQVVRLFPSSRCAIGTGGTRSKHVAPG